MPEYVFTPRNVTLTDFMPLLMWFNDQLPANGAKDYPIAAITYAEGIVLEPIRPRATIKGWWLADSPLPRHPRRKRVK